MSAFALLCGQAPPGPSLLSGQASAPLPPPPVASETRLTGRARSACIVRPPTKRIPAVRTALTDLVQDRRRALGLTQIAIAARLGLRCILVSHVERGRLRPQGDMLFALARALELPVSALHQALEDARLLHDAPRADVWSLMTYHRVQRGLTITSLAKKISVPARQLRSWEKRPKDWMLERLEVALELAPGTLLGAPWGRP